jgi:hypothetical protein
MENISKTKREFYISLRRSLPPAALRQVALAMLSHCSDSFEQKKHGTGEGSKSNLM